MAELSKWSLSEATAWLAQLLGSDSLWVLLALAVSLALSWLMVWGLRQVVVGQSLAILLGRRLYDGVLFPVLLLGLVFVAQTLMTRQQDMPLFAVVLPVCITLAVIRLGVKVLQVAFVGAPFVRVLERTISWVAFAAAALWITGILPLVLKELDQISWKVGASELSVRTMIEGALTAGLVLIAALWVSAAIEARLLRSATGSDLSLRKVISNSVRALLMFVGLLLALSSVGIDLTALSVLGGAIGVGIGFGLQKLASNYVSGFVILAERSIRIGDMVLVDGFEGRIVDIKARYTVIRALNGRESIVPNEYLIINRVENFTLLDSRMAQTTLVSVAYDSDVDLVRRLLIEACTSQDRVLKDPAPNAFLSQFGADGLDFTVSYWIADPENGQLGLRSAINLLILAALREHKIEIPYPQRVMHMVNPSSKAATD